jgi:hypothetical protein
MGQHNENTIQVEFTAYFKISINQEGRSQRRIPSELLPNLVRKGLQYRVPSNTRRITVRLRGHGIDPEGASSAVHHRIRYFAKILAGGRLGQNSTTLQRQMVVSHPAARESLEGEN